MIGAFLDSLTPEQEDRLLTTRLIPFRDSVPALSAGCLLAVAFGGLPSATEAPHYSDEAWRELCERQLAEWGELECVAERFNGLCLRLGGVLGAARRRLGRLHDVYAVGVPDELQLRGAARAGALIRDRVWRNAAKRIHLDRAHQLQARG